MADRINFSKKINDSVQVGDELWWTQITVATNTATNGIPLLVGEITEVGEKYVKVDPITVTPTFVAGTIFLMFRKPEHAHANLPYGGYTNVSSLKGYYAEATFTNGSTTKQELFAIGSEITVSSK